MSQLPEDENEEDTKINSAPSTPTQPLLRAEIEEQTVKIQEDTAKPNTETSKATGNHRNDREVSHKLVTDQIKEKSKVNKRSRKKKFFQQIPTVI